MPEHKEYPELGICKVFEYKGCKAIVPYDLCPEGRCDAKVVSKIVQDFWERSFDADRKDRPEALGDSESVRPYKMSNANMPDHKRIGHALQR